MSESTAVNSAKNWFVFFDILSKAWFSVIKIKKRLVMSESTAANFANKLFFFNIFKLFAKNLIFDNYISRATSTTLAYICKGWKNHDDVPGDVLGHTYIYIYMCEKVLRIWRGRYRRCTGSYTSTKNEKSTKNKKSKKNPIHPIAKNCSWYTSCTSVSSPKCLFPKSLAPIVWHCVSQFTSSTSHR